MCLEMVLSPSGQELMDQDKNRLEQLTKAELISEIQHLRENSEKNSDPAPDVRPDLNATQKPDRYDNPEIELNELIDAIENMDAGFILYDADDHFIRCNPRHTDYYPHLMDVYQPGIPRSVAIRKHAEHMAETSPEFDVEVYCAKRAEYRGIPRSVEERQLPDGRWLSIREHLTSSGGMVTVRTDITERKHAERRLSERENFHRTLTKLSPAGVFQTNRKGEILFVNERWCQLHGITSDEAYGNGWLDSIDPTHVVQLKQSWDKAIRWGDGLDVEYRTVNSDGAGQWLHVQWAPANGSDEQPIGYIGVASDISANKEAGQELVESEARFRDYAEAASDWYWEQDADLRFTYLSPQCQAVTGHSNKVFIGKTRKEVFVASGLEIDETWAEHFRCTEAHESFSKFVYVVPRRDGVRKVIKTSGKAIFDEQGVFKGYRGVGSDVTEQIEREEALLVAKEAAERSNRAKSEFLSTISHELRTPITSIRGALGLILGGALGEIESQTKEMISMADLNCERLGGLINDLLDMEGAQTGKLNYQMNPANILSIVEHAVEINRSYAARFKINLIIDDTNLGQMFILGDKNRLLQMMGNLLSNAAKFSSEGEEVHIRVDKVDEQVKISVIDRGAGIPKKFHETLFDPFTQADGSDTRNHGGSGLGLGITKAIIERHGGQINFTSAAGKGTTFVVELPLMFHHVANPAESDAPHEVTSEIARN